MSIELEGMELEVKTRKLIAALEQEIEKIRSHPITADDLNEQRKKEALLSAGVLIKNLNTLCNECFGSNPKKFTVIESNGEVPYHPV